MLQNKVIIATKTAKFAAGGAKLCTARYMHSSQSNPTLQKAYLASSSVDRVQKPWLDAELLIAPQLLGGHYRTSYI